MNKKRLKVVVTRKLPEPVETRMKELFDVELSDSLSPANEKILSNLVERADILVSTIGDKISKKLISENIPKLRLIANYGAGYDHIDVRKAVDSGVVVTNTPGVLTEDTADTVMALILTVPRRIKEGTQKMLDDSWEGWSPTALLGSRIGGKRLGILGMGRIG